MEPTGQKPIKFCDVHGWTEHNAEQGSGGWRGKCRECEKARTFKSNLAHNPVNNAISALVDKWTGSGEATYLLPKAERIALRGKASVIIVARAPSNPKGPFNTRVDDPVLIAMREQLDAEYKALDTRVQTQIKAGWVYFFTNPAWPDWFSCGQTIDYLRRLADYQRSCPHRDFVMAHKVYFTDRRKAERIIHRCFKLVCVTWNHEWFNMDLNAGRFIADNVKRDEER